MFDTLMRLYKEGKLSDAGLENAVTKGWITQEQAETIKNEGVDNGRNLWD